MEKQNKVKSRRKCVNPVFHLQTKDENDQHMTKDVIKKVRTTGQLNLSSRHLSEVPEKLFSIYELTNENEINIDLSRPVKEEEAWWNIKTLTHLDLSSNVLTNLPKQIGMFQDLVVLNLHDNLLTSLPEEISSLTKLTKLSLNHNKITNLPQGFFNLTELKQLFISHNCLDSVSKDISDLVMLEKLDLSNNVILNLPSGIGFLVRLTELNVSNNKLAKLPPDIVNLRALLKMDISHNSITQLPDMGELRKLQILYAQHNDIREIPGFFGCEQVHEIYFGNNFIEEIPLEFCENMNHLKILELRDNQIKAVPSEITKLAHLTKFDLTNNDIEELPNAMGLMPHLQSFKIEGNKLKQIRPDIIHTGTNRILRHLREKISDEELQILSVPSDVSYDCKIYPDRYTMRNGNILNLALKNISDVPEECFMEAKEANVSNVDLCKNKFVDIPHGLKLLSNTLTELNMSCNRISNVPEFLMDLTKLKFCDLSKNQLEDLPDSLSSLVYIRELILSNNRFKKIPNCIFQMVGIEILLMNDNNIEEIPIDNLKMLTRIATLDLSNNSINYVPPELGNIKQLRWISSALIII
ncbi:leucine-rich repeat-containing protein 40-like isoform X2 [Diabrotica virgifera virgifera]|uniref:Leucine-rich repeat-containing protein 40-like isoform X2 n=1 Tax=Diabrotica virgifera virgifera TaxID=50390 RepID=A0A6P7G109_DIAVI|nr:leucine-rich repeat-containing protein 40-like isoform X2 [Diabrotica virgifera virgifera]